LLERFPPQFINHQEGLAMTRLLAGLRNRFLATQIEPRRSLSGRRARPCVEILEDRTTPSVTASATLSGSVFLGAGQIGLSGTDVTLTGTTTTGRTVDVTTATGANGAYSFTSLLPGTYSVSDTAPSGFANGSQTSVSGIAVAVGQTIKGVNFTVPGLVASSVSLADFLASSSSSPRHSQPAPGAGSAAGFSFDTATALKNQAVGNGATVFLDLSSNFIDPDTTNGTIVSFNTSQGVINVTLYDKDAPQTVTNFLNMIQAGDYGSDLFQRLSNLSQVSPTTPPPTPFQVLQGGGFTVITDASGNVTGFTALTTFQPINNESNDAVHPNDIGTLAMARSSNVNSATSQFFFNLTNNAQALGGASANGFAVFGNVADSTSLNNLQHFATQYTPTDESASNSNFFALPLANGFTPASNFPIGATTADLALTNSVTVTKPPTGQLTYAIVGNTDPTVVTATLGANTAGSIFSASQLQLVGKNAGSSVITVQITDAKGEIVTKQFTVTVS
jgi:cyclophilin family peptidyl-prolyl cis-trans isomerase